MRRTQLLENTHKPKYQINTTKQFINTHQSENNFLNFSNQKKHNYKNSLMVDNP